MALSIKMMLGVITCLAIFHFSTESGQTTSVPPKISDLKGKWLIYGINSSSHEWYVVLYTELNPVDKSKIEATSFDLETGDKIMENLLLEGSELFAVPDSSELNASRTRFWTIADWEPNKFIVISNSNTNGSVASDLYMVLIKINTTMSFELMENIFDRLKNVTQRST